MVYFYRATKCQKGERDKGLTIGNLEVLEARKREFGNCSSIPDDYW